MKLTQVIPLISSLSLGIATVYLMAFWGEFGIDIFQFLIISDYISQAITPLFKFIVSIGFGILFIKYFDNPGMTLLSKLNIPDSELMVDGKLPWQRRFGNFMIKAVLVIPALHLILTGTSPIEISIGSSILAIPIVLPFWDKYIDGPIPIKSI